MGLKTAAALNVPSAAAADADAEDDKASVSGGLRSVEVVSPDGWGASLRFLVMYMGTLAAVCRIRRH